MQVKIQLLNTKARMPEKSTDGSACFDVYATNSEIVAVQPESGAVLGTGLAFEIPEGFAMMVYSRSGHGFKNNVRLANSTGIIDSDYRGELKVKLTADSQTYLVKPGERIAQFMIIPVPAVEFYQDNVDIQTKRGTDGFGSTGTL